MSSPTRPPQLASKALAALRPIPFVKVSRARDNQGDGERCCRAGPPDPERFRQRRRPLRLRGDRVRSLAVVRLLSDI